MEAGWGEVAPRDVGWCDGTCEADEARRMEDLDRAKFEIVCLKQQLAHVHRELERMSNALHVAIGAKPPM